MVKETCVLTFTTTSGVNKNIHVADPRPNISAGQISTAALGLTGKNMFDSSVGTLGNLIGASVIRETTIQLLPVA